MTYRVPRPEINVRDYGAMGDGVTDDTAAFQAALTYANGAGRKPSHTGALLPPTIRVPAGTFKLSTALDVYPGFSMVGESAITSQDGLQLTSKLWNPTSLSMFRIPTGLGAAVSDLAWEHLAMYGATNFAYTDAFPGNQWLSHPTGLVTVRCLHLLGCRINSWNSLWGTSTGVVGSTGVNSALDGGAALAGVGDGPLNTMMLRIEDCVIDAIGMWDDRTYTAPTTAVANGWTKGLARSTIYLFGSDGWVVNSMFGGQGNGRRHPANNRGIYIVSLQMSATAFMNNHIVGVGSSHLRIQQSGLLTVTGNRMDPGASTNKPAFTGGSRTSNVVTLTGVDTGHGMVAGMLVTVAAADATYNGSFIVTGSTTNTITYAQVAADDASSGAGTASHGGTDEHNVLIYNSKNISFRDNWVYCGANAPATAGNNQMLLLLNAPNCHIENNWIQDLADVQNVEPAVGVYHIEVQSNGNLNWPAQTSAGATDKDMRNTVVRDNKYGRDLLITPATGAQIVPGLHRLQLLNSGLASNLEYPDYFRDGKGQILSTVVQTATGAPTARLVQVDSTSASVTVQLPTAVGIAGRAYTVKKLVAANNCVVDPNGSQTMDGSSASLTTADQWAQLELISDGANWLILNRTGTWA